MHGMLQLHCYMSSLAKDSPKQPELLTVEQYINQNG